MEDLFYKFDSGTATREDKLNTLVVLMDVEASLILLPEFDQLAREKIGRCIDQLADELL